jgi:hypothetical protein
VISALQACRSEVEALQAALSGRDPAAITAATERLAAAIVTMRDQPLDAASAGHASAMIADVMALMECAAIQVNMLRAGTRQRIDNLRNLRGASAGIAPQTYKKAY